MNDANETLCNDLTQSVISVSMCTRKMAYCSIRIRSSRVINYTLLKQSNTAQTMAGQLLRDRKKNKFVHRIDSNGGGGVGVAHDETLTIYLNRIKVI